MLTPENVGILTDWTAEVQRCEVALSAAIEGRDKAVRQALEMQGVTAVEVATVTGLTRARIYQIRDHR